MNKQDDYSTTVPQCPYNYYGKTTSAVWCVVWPMKVLKMLKICSARRQRGEACGEMMKDGSDIATTSKFDIFPLSCSTAPASSSSVKAA